MKFQAMLWSPFYEPRAEKAQFFNTKRSLDVEVRPGKYVVRAVQSRLYLNREGRYLGPDERFAVEWVDDYWSYPIGQQSHPIQTGPYAGTGKVVETEFLVVAHDPFTLRSWAMRADDSYGESAAGLVELPARKAAQVVRGMQLSDINCVLFFQPLAMANP